MNRKLDESQVALMLKNFTAAETARRLGVSERQVRRIKKRLGIQGRPLMTRPDPDIEKGLIFVYRAAGHSLRETGRRLGRSHEAIRMEAQWTK